jgi:alkaline phosphatase
MELTRRSLLSLGALSLTASSLPVVRAGEIWKGKKPKNIIFCVCDGMAAQVPTMSDYFQQLTMGRRSYWATLMEQEYAVNALEETRSLSSIVTDSAAASTSWGAGRRVWNGMINMYPDKTPLRAIVDIMTSAGMKCGLVTTTTATHATPSGFAVSIINRDFEGKIAELQLTSGIQVLMGGGDKFFNAQKRPDKIDLYEKFRAAGFTVAKSRDEMMSHRSGKILGIYSDSHVPYTIDRDHDSDIQEQVPTIAEMAAKAIDCLKGNKNGFLLQIEGGKVDHAGHANDIAAMLYDMMAFEEAVKVAVDFALKDGETLVIITADHATGGPSMNGDGVEYADSPAALMSIGQMKASVTETIAAFGKDGDKAIVHDVVKDKLAIELKDDEAAAIAGINKGEHPFKLARLYDWKGGSIGAILGNYARVTWTSGNHTCDHVWVTAVGPGSEKFHGVVPNYKMFDLMLDAKGLKWDNPKMTYEEAKKHMGIKKDGEEEAEMLALYSDPAERGVHLGA